MLVVSVSPTHTSASAAMFHISAPRPQRAKQQVKGGARDSYSETLIGPVADGWRLIMPITLEVERDEHGSFLATESITTVYGYGESGPEAIRDYVQSLIEYFEIVDASSSPESQALSRALKRYLAHK